MRGALLISTLAAWLTLCGLLSPSHAAKEPEVDYLGLAAVMLRDGHPDRAIRELDKVDLTDEELDAPRYYTLRGVASLRQRDFQAALDGFDKAIEAGATDMQLHLFRARCAYALEDCDLALSALDAAGPELAGGEPDFFVMRAECHWKGKRYAQSLVALDEGEARFPEQRDFARTRIYRLLELSLYQTAVEAGRAFLETGAGDIDDYLFVSEALLQAEQALEARAILEEARLRFGDDERILVQLGHAWLGSNHPLVAAGMFRRASLFNPKYARDAAELYRENQLFGRALSLNGRLIDQKAKLRQRLAILLDMERFEAVASLEPRLARLGLLAEDEELRYALAYARFRVGDYRRAERHLQRLTKAQLFERAAQLRKAMADCRAGTVPCD